ncbi:MAG: hypothetical protein CMO01_16745 [Thalassobius sp.]|nr:hypothetical protein [Thalassovita sp.]
MSELIKFEGTAIRKTEFEGEIYYSVLDVILALTDSKNPKVYWSQLKKRESQPFTFCKQLKLKAADGRMRSTDCATRTGILRIIQSIPSPKAEPFKKWMAEVGSERIDEQSNKRLEARRKLQESQNKLYENAKSRGVDEEGFNEVLREGDKALFNGENMHEKYGIDEEENLDDHMHELLLRGKDFATAITNVNVSKKDLFGKENISDEHTRQNKEVRDVLKRQVTEPENIPPQEDIKKLSPRKKELE